MYKRIDKNINENKQSILLNTNYTSIIVHERGHKASTNNFTNMINQILTIFENNL